MTTGVSNEEAGFSSSDRRDEGGGEQKMKQMQGRQCRPVPSHSVAKGVVGSFAWAVFKGTGTYSIYKL